MSADRGEKAPPYLWSIIKWIIYFLSESVTPLLTLTMLRLFIYQHNCYCYYLSTRPENSLGTLRPLSKSIPMRENATEREYLAVVLSTQTSIGNTDLYWMSTSLPVSRRIAGSESMLISSITLDISSFSVITQNFCNERKTKVLWTNQIGYVSYVSFRGARDRLFHKNNHYEARISLNFALVFLCTRKATLQWTVQTYSFLFEKFNSRFFSCWSWVWSRKKVTPSFYF